MSDRADEGDDGSGCLMLFGIIIVGIATGYLFQQAYGWLVIGSLFILWAIAPRRKS